MKGERFTFISRNPVLQVAVKREIMVTDITATTISYYVKGKPKRTYQYCLTISDLLLPGWHHPLTMDHELGRYGKRGLINIVTDVPEFTKGILMKNVNARFDMFETIMFTHKAKDDWQPLFKK